MTNDKDLIDALRQNCKEKEEALEQYRDDLRKHRSTIEWIIQTLKSILSVLEDIHG